MTDKIYGFAESKERIEVVPKATYDQDMQGVQPAGDYVTTEALTEALEGKQDAGSYATTSDLSAGLAGVTEALSEGLAGKQDKGDYATNTALTEGLAGKQDTILRFKDLTATYVESTTYADYGYEAALTCPGVTEDMFAEVAYSLEQAVSGNHAPFCETGANTVTIYSKAADSVTVDVVVL